VHEGVVAFRQLEMVTKSDELSTIHDGHWR